MHAIAEENSREGNIHSAQSLSRRNSRRKSRKNSKISASEEENLIKNQNSEPNSVSKQKQSEISLNGSNKQASESGSLVRENLNLNLTNAKKTNQLPIITQTCPTPTYTPTSSSNNSPLPNRFFFGSEIKAVRKFSLDSSNQRIKLAKINQPTFLTNSTNSRIFDETKELSLKTARSDIADLGRTKIESILKKNHLGKKFPSPKRIDFQFSKNAPFLKSRNKSVSTLVMSPPKIILDLSTEKDSIITNDSNDKENNVEKPCVNRLRRKRLSKSFHEKLLVNSSTLAIPKAVYKRPRSKSERIKTKTNKISDKNEEIISTDGLGDNQESSIVINITNHKPVLIKKSVPFNIDINLSKSKSENKIDSNSNKQTAKARLV